MESRHHGLFLGFPAQSVRNRKLVHLVEPVTKEAGALLREAVLTEYKRLTGWSPAAKGGSGEPEAGA